MDKRPPKEIRDLILTRKPRGKLEHAFRYGAILIVVTSALLGFMFGSAIAALRPHVYLFRGLADVFSTGMDTLAVIRAQVDITKRAVETRARSHVSVITLSKIDDARYVSRDRERLSTVKRHHKSDWYSFVT